MNAPEYNRLINAQEEEAVKIAKEYVTTALRITNYCDIHDCSNMAQPNMWIEWIIEHKGGIATNVYTEYCIEHFTQVYRQYGARRAIIKRGE